jgi:hypothetical protein
MIDLAHRELHRLSVALRVVFQAGAMIGLAAGMLLPAQISGFVLLALTILAILDWRFGR